SLAPIARSPFVSSLPFRLSSTSATTTARTNAPPPRPMIRPYCRQKDSVGCGYLDAAESRDPAGFGEGTSTTSSQLGHLIFLPAVSLLATFNCDAQSGHLNTIAIFLAFLSLRDLSATFLLLRYSGWCRAAVGVHRTVRRIAGSTEEGTVQSFSCSISKHNRL